MEDSTTLKELNPADLDNQQLSPEAMEELSNGKGDDEDE